MDRNGYFKLKAANDGIYLKCYKPEGNGTGVKIDDVIFYLDSKGYKDFDVKALNIYIQENDFESRFKISDQTFIKENEFLQLDIDKYGLKVIGKFFPPTDGGDKMTVTDIIDELKRNNIVSGYVKKNIEIFVKARLYCTNILLAKAKMPIHGSDAVIDYYFDTDVIAKPKLNDDGTVDFHQLGNISHINKGDKIAHLTPADLGTPGMDIFGRVIPAKKVVRKILRHGRSITLSDDKLDMYSDVSGHVTLLDDTVFVSDTYEVQSNVDASTGDIEYNGNVLVKGNVNTGYSVKASGDISVNGVVEGATLIAGGDINLRLGVQGMFRAVLQAGGNIISRFLENCKEVTAGGTVGTDAIMHSVVKAKSDITVKGKRGLITGGQVVSGTVIHAKTVGSYMETQTVLEVGIDPSKMERYRELEKDVAEKQEEMKRIMQVFEVYQKRLKLGGKIDPDKATYIQNAHKLYKQYDDGNKVAQEEMKLILKEMDDSRNGKIIISGTTCAGVTITIARATMRIKDETVRTKFVKDGADIRMESY